MFISVKFQPADVKTYTYRYDGKCEVNPGDFCVVETRDGRKPVEVTAVDVQEPAFECKPIIAILTERGPS